MGLFGSGKKAGRKGKAPRGAAVPSADLTSPLDDFEPPKKKIDWVTVIVVIIMIVGAGIIAYPTFSDWWNSYHQSRAIATYVTAVEEIDQETIDAMLGEAHAYNERLLQKPNRYMMSDAERTEYESILDITGTGVIGYIQIPIIGVNLPIYHGVAEAVLQVAIGHIEGTSLPVGGPSTHAAVSGHRGLPSAKLFTDLDKLVEGDTFTVTVLNQTITYQIDQIRIVEPADMSDLNITRDKDECTLVTCTPYGINTHRLLVRGHRVANITGNATIPADAVQIPNYVAVPAVALPMLFVYLVGALIYYRVSSNGYNKKQVMKELNRIKNRQIKREQAEAKKSAELAAQIVAEAGTEEPKVEGAEPAAVEPEAAESAAAELEADEPAAETEVDVTEAAESEVEAAEAETGTEPEEEEATEQEPEAEPEPEAEAEIEAAEPEAEEVEAPEANNAEATEPEAEATEPEAEAAATTITDDANMETNQQKPAEMPSSDDAFESEDATSDKNVENPSAKDGNDAPNGDEMRG